MSEFIGMVIVIIVPFVAIAAMVRAELRAKLETELLMAKLMRLS